MWCLSHFSLFLVFVLGLSFSLTLSKNQANQEECDTLLFTDSVSLLTDALSVSEALNGSVIELGSSVLLRSTKLSVDSTSVFYTSVFSTKCSVSSGDSN